MRWQGQNGSFGDAVLGFSPNEFNVALGWPPPYLGPLDRLLEPSHNIFSGSHLARACEGLK